MAVTFDEEYNYSVSGKASKRVIQTQYGDGYSQRSADGINSVDKSWNPTYQFTRREDVQSFIDKIEENADEYVFWQSPSDRTPSKYVIDSWNLDFQGEWFSEVSVTFRLWHGN